MRRRHLVLLLAACALDPQGVLDRAALKVQAEMLAADGGQLKLQVTDSRGVPRSKATKVTATRMEIVFEQGSLADGRVAIAAELFAADGLLIGCATTSGTAGGENNTVLLGFASPSNDPRNCGTCGNRCETELATGECTNGRCAMFQCAPGLIDEPDGGCTDPQADAGTADAGMCTPVGAEDSEGACSNGLDDDCDGRTDCADLGCTALSRSCTQTNACMSPGMQTWSCPSRTWGACAGWVPTEDSVALCRDGVDNDCDGQKDCQDPDCDNVRVPCGVDVCAAGVKLWLCTLNIFNACLPYIPVPENTGPLCGNALDDDCDAHTDCLDSTCRGRACAMGRVCCADGGCATSCL